ncbi:MAG: Fic family protein, partial [Spirochaetales bacterium]|nr:Fic family protein [Spirochaetales bacterium]
TFNILNLVEQIGEQIGRLSAESSRQQILQLRRISTIKTIQGSLAIEGNTLSVEQVTAVLDRKRVLASQRDIQEVENAIEAYDRMENWNPLSMDDLLDAHAVLMKGLIADAGQIRTGAVGIKRNEVVIHLAPPASNVKPLLRELLSFIHNLKLPELIKSCVFHYEFEFLHPFSDGNGRLGRLWQTLILGKWNPSFFLIPLESVIRDYQAEYYSAFNRCNQEVHPGIFVEFMLELILKTLQTVDTAYMTPVTPSVTPPVAKLLRLLQIYGALGNRELLEMLQLKDRRRMRETYINPAKKQEFIEYTIPDKPTSRNQQYRLTPKGRQLIEELKEN